jgi:hypothetical protein
MRADMIEEGERRCIHDVDRSATIEAQARRLPEKQKMDRIAIALPPFAEQHRIVAKVDALMALCDQLEASLTRHRRSPAAACR